MFEFIFIIIGTVSALLILMFDKNVKNIKINILFSFLLGFLFSGIFLLNAYYYFDKPIDVYRGNTKLNVSYTILNGDTISIDSVVTRVNK